MRSEATNRKRPAHCMGMPKEDLVNTRLLAEAAHTFPGCLDPK